MRERLNELKGGLEIEAANPGMRLRAIVPLFPELCRLTLEPHVTREFPFAGVNQLSHSHAALNVKGTLPDCNRAMHRSDRLGIFGRHQYCQYGGSVANASCDGDEGFRDRRMSLRQSLKTSH